MPTPLRKQLRKRRDALTMSGFPSMQIWVPDTERPGFADECRRQSLLVAATDNPDRGLDAFLEAALEDLGKDAEV